MNNFVKYYIIGCFVVAFVVALTASLALSSEGNNGKSPINNDHFNSWRYDFYYGSVNINDC